MSIPTRQITRQIACNINGHYWSYNVFEDTYDLFRKIAILTLKISNIFQNRPPTHKSGKIVIKGGAVLHFLNPSRFPLNDVDIELEKPFDQKRIDDIFNITNTLKKTNFQFDMCRVNEHMYQTKILRGVLNSPRFKIENLSIDFVQFKQVDIDFFLNTFRLEISFDKCGIETIKLFANTKTIIDLYLVMKDKSIFCHLFEKKDGQFLVPTSWSARHILIARIEKMFSKGISVDYVKKNTDGKLVVQVIKSGFETTIELKNITSSDIIKIIPKFKSYDFFDVCEYLHFTEQTLL
jgi:hypothetical protein